MKQFSLSSENPIVLLENEILEFSELNKEIKTLTTKVRSDYKNLKQFTEDVSHEMQTPLAIIQAKIENFINGESLTNEQFAQITSVQKDIQRLSQLNKKLVLISKIDNNQFTIDKAVIINEILKEVVNDFRDLTSAEINIIEKSNLIIHADPQLIRILCSNLISNAVKYREACSKIEVIIQNNYIIVANLGSQSLQEPNKIFSRYYRENNTLKSTGLGLTIVKKICDLHGFKVFYLYENHQHIFKIDFQNNLKN
jgi:two-component system, OmpR family, sensor kinase